MATKTPAQMTVPSADSPGALTFPPEVGLFLKGMLRMPTTGHLPLGIEGMSKVQETFSAAAEAAQNVLPALEEQRQSLIAQVQAVDAMIQKLRGVIANADLASTPPTVETSEAREATLVLAGRDVDQVLYESDQPLKVNEIAEVIKLKFGREWASSTIYGHLTKQKTKDMVANAGGRWVMTDGGRDNVAF